MITGRLKVRVSWGDCDPANIVFYPSYYGWFDDATHHLFEQVGLDYRTLRESYGIVGMPIVDAHAQFLLPSQYGDELIVESHVESWSTKSLKVAHRIMKGVDLAVEGHEVRIWARRHPDDSTRLKTYPIPREVKDLFAR